MDKFDFILLKSRHLIILQYFYYYRQRDTPEKWKCQPNHWLPLELEVKYLLGPRNIKTN